MNQARHVGLTFGKLLVAAAICTILTVIIVNAIKAPVEGETKDYSADFTDVSGLHENGDVRVKGLQVGKVKSIEMVRVGGATVARVHFSLEEGYELTEDSRLAVKYQSLTGVRYLDFTEGPDGGVSATHLSLDNTAGAFDITELFNGLQPVLATMSTDEVNAFTQNAIMVLQGDGGGLSPMMRSAEKLASLASDRQQVISTLTANMSRIAETMGNRSPQVIQFIQAVHHTVLEAKSALVNFYKTADFGPKFVTPLHRLVTQLGLESDMDIDAMVADVFPNFEEAIEAISLLPNTLAAMQVAPLSPRAQRGRSGPCANGVAKLPSAVTVLLNGSEVTVCNPR
ncbi:MlaD family protein [Gordonia sp. KTR9]|uniref:MlaD family protein n=1 Tax=Gordonia sp. KTR9 TaxID=337191 RepID=UPI00027DDBBD|nr:MlaD family protein [Gordonia sp. KTR9]AFR48176.1 ABC-type transport system involved in resistance to organic solvents, periplasmic component [Gordonia sp. KTR9]